MVLQPNLFTVEIKLVEYFMASLTIYSYKAAKGLLMEFLGDKIANYYCHGNRGLKHSRPISCVARFW